MHSSSDPLGLSFVRTIGSNSTEEGQSLKSLEKKPIRKGLGFNCIDCNGRAIREYHVDSYTKLEAFVDEANRKLGGFHLLSWPAPQRW
jgi:hypothetical protein